MRTSRLLALNPADGRARELRLGKKELTVGCDEGNDLTIVGGGVSRRHAVIRYRAGGYELRELNSTNGTFVNNQRIVVSTLLKDGDEIRFGAARFTFLDQKEIRPMPIERKPSRRRIGLRTAIGLLLVLFLIGFAVAEYLINRHYFSWRLGRISSANSTSKTDRATLMAGAKAAANHETVTLSVPRAATSVAQPDWLARVNYYRAMAKLPPVVEDSALSDGDLKHARYLVENYPEVIKKDGSLGAAAHSEEDTNSWYTPEGSAAARNSDVYDGCNKMSREDQVDGWVVGPFHRLSILNPDLAAVGYGRYDKDRCWSAALDLHLTRKSIAGRPLSVSFPADGSMIPTPDFDGNEWPPPLAGCPGYAQPVGFPITLQTRWKGIEPPVAHLLTKNGKAVAHCELDQANYANANQVEQDWGRKVLKSYGAVILIPQEPLIAGAMYQVSIAAGGKSYDWSFTVRLR
ncbi:MAG TPA: FHA domain-containing protein [Candidatus Binataceae bacterium]